MFKETRVRIIEELYNTYTKEWEEKKSHVIDSVHINDFLSEIKLFMLGTGYQISSEEIITIVDEDEYCEECELREIQDVQNEQEELDTLEEIFNYGERIEPKNKYEHKEDLGEL